MIYMIIKEDLIDPKFIENVKLICLTALIGSCYYDEAREKDVPYPIKSNWLYILMWISKDICERQEDKRSIANAVK